jgi:hypothetical protein
MVLGHQVKSMRQGLQKAKTGLAVLRSNANSGGQGRGPRRSGLSEAVHLEERRIRILEQNLHDAEELFGLAIRHTR